MKKFTNAFALKDEQFNCFGCSPNNKTGLHLEFYTDNNIFWSEWNPNPSFDGWSGIVHGGIQATIADETAEWLIFTKYGRAAMTAELAVKYKRPLESVTGPIKAYATEVSFEKNIAEISVKIHDSEQKLCTIATGKFFVASLEDSKNKFDFPDIEEF